MSKPVILTGLRANNDLHLGNYLGAMLPMVDMANAKAGEFQVNMFIPDLHSFTTPIDHSKLKDQIMHNARLFAAAGLNLDDESINLYRQSYISAHSELTIILNSFAYFGELTRMTQFKDKVLNTEEKKQAFQRYSEGLKQKDIELSKRGRAEQNYITTLAKKVHISAGLFDYPVLMAADILLYGALYVPVGDDQSQHLEFTRDIAERMNSKFDQELFVIPKSVKEQHQFFNKDQGLRIRDLQDPNKKMSKSDQSGKGVIFLGDSPEVAKKKIMSAATDSLGEVQHDYKTRPGISNLLDIYERLGGDSKQFIGQSQYGDFKKAVAEQVAEFLAGFQQKLEAVGDQQLEQKLQISEAAMQQQANQTLARVQVAIGLR